MNRQEILLKEYEVCQQSANEAHRRIWQITGILLVFALGSSFGAFWLMSMSSECGNEQRLLLISVALLAIGFDAFWISAWVRERSYLAITYHRLQQIEILLGLRKNLYIYALDNSKPPRYLSEDEKKRWMNQRQAFLERECIENLKLPHFWQIRTAFIAWSIAVLIFVFWAFVILNYLFKWVTWLA